MPARPKFAFFASLALLLAGPAHAFTGGPESRGEVQLPGRSAVRIDHADIQRSLDDGGAWRGFRARYGEWTAQWNELTRTPHRALGRGIVLNGYTNDAASVDRAVRAFIGANTNLFGAATLRTVRANRTGDVWYVSYRQTLNGMDVLFSDWEFRVHASGQLMMFGADGHAPATMPSRGGVIAAAAAREAARVGVAFDATRDHVDGGSELFVLPYPTDAGLEYRVVTEARVVTADPPADWLTYVDAKTGEVLIRTNRVRDAITGTVSGMIHPLLPTDPLTPRPFSDLFVNAGVALQPTTTSGTYSLNVTGTVTVTAGLSGTFANVIRQDAGNSTFSQVATNPAVVNIAWGNPVPSHDAERDAYYSVNVAHAYIKSLDPTFTGLDYSMPVTVNVNDICNAFWSLFNGGVYFYAAGGGCVNTATVPDVVYHEYGHGVNDKTYQFEGATNGMFNGSMHEGMADVNAAFLQDDPIVGQGFSGPGTFVRNTDNTNRWPDDNAGEEHTNGLIIGGAFWDLRQAVGLPVAQLLAVRARHGTPDDPNDGVAFAEMFTEVLVADDDDGNLANGTPHGAAIISAFNAHGIGTNYYLSIDPTPVADPPSGDLFPVTAMIAYSGPAISALDTSSPTLHFRLNPKPGVVWSTTPMLPTGTVGQFRGRIPAPDGAVVEYYITASDVSGGSKTSPPGAPVQTAFRFLVGTPTPGTTWSMETDPGWLVGGPSDGAITGVWLRVDPIGTFTGSDPFVIAVQTEDDHTPAPGTQCWVTGNADAVNGIGFADVDGGQTTLTTATFNPLTGGVTHPVIEYYRWYTNAAGGAPGLDVWETDISSDGGTTWTPVENTMASNAAWQRVLFRVEDFVTPTSNMRMRFIASDFAEGSVVEAAVDDFRVLAFPPGSLAVDDPLDGLTLAFAPPAPNPFRARVSLRFTLPAAAPASLVLYDVSGRAVRHLVDGTLEAGPHAFEWDGRDDARAPLPSGLYFADLATSQQHLVRRVIQVR